MSSRTLRGETLSLCRSKFSFRIRPVWTVLLVCSTISWGASGAMGDERSYQLQSAEQGGTTLLRVLLPDSLAPGRRYSTLYILPVEEGAGTRWGDPVAEARQLDLANRFEVICVFPQFAQLPWYANHPTDSRIQQESYFLKTVIPFVERNCPANAEQPGRLLLGFSKSGFGAWSLLLRHPDLFARAAAFDAPLMQDKPDKYGMGPIFGTQENFDGYRIPTLLENQSSLLRKPGPPRLILIGAGNFELEHDRMHELLQALMIPHEFVAGPRREHAWGSGWMEPAVKLLLQADPSQSN